MARRLLTKLKTTLQSNIALYGVILAFLVLSTYSIIFTIPLIFIIIKLRRKLNFKILIIIIILFLLSYLGYYFITKIDFKSGIYKVEKVQKYGFKNLIVARKGILKYAFYSAGDYKRGDCLKISGESLKRPKTSVFNTISEVDTLLSRRISGYIKVNSIEVLSKGKGSTTSKFFELFPKNTKVFISLLFNPNYINYELKKSFTDLGIISAVAFSSLQIGFIIKVIKKVLYYVNINEGFKNIIISIFLFVLTFLFKENLPLIRYLIIYIILSISYFLGTEIRRFQLNYLAFIIITLLFPNFIFSYSYKLIFCYTFISYYFYKYLRRFNPFIQSIISYYLFYLITLPVLSQFVNEFSILIFLLGPLLILAFRYFFIPLIFLSLLIYPISYVADPIFGLILKGINIISNNKIYITIPRFNIIFIILYMTMLLLILFRKRKYLFVITFVFIVLVNEFKFYINPFAGISFFNVGQGNTTLIRDSFGKNVIVIDYFGNARKKLKSMGVFRIDHLILTHGDYDHVGNIENDSQYMKITNVYLNNSDKYPKVRAKNKIVINNDLKKTLGGLELEFLKKEESLKKNDNSLVTKIKIKNITFLSTGDISKNVELKYVDKYKENLKCDILHIPHHGSKYSLSDEFLNYTNPSLGIISCGIDNSYGFPNLETIKKLDNKKIPYKLTFKRDMTNYYVLRRKYFKFL